MSIYTTITAQPLKLNADGSVHLKSEACFSHLRGDILRRNAYVSVEITRPDIWVPGFDIAVNECVEYIGNLLPVRVIPCAGVVRSGTNYNNNDDTSGMQRLDLRESLVIEVQYTHDTLQDMLFFALNHFRFLAPEFYVNGLMFKAGEANTEIYPPIPERKEEKPITSYRMYLDHTLFDTPVNSNHVPIRHGSPFGGIVLDRESVLSYWFDGPLHWIGPTIKEVTYFSSLNEDDIHSELELRKTLNKE